MPCTICQHPDCQAIDQALLARTATLAALGQQYNLSTSALHRHKQHLQKKMTHVRLRFQDILNEGCLMILNSFLEMIIRTSRTAEAEGNSRLVLQAARQGTAILKFMHKLGFPLTPETVHRLLSSPGWADQGNLLPPDAKFFLGSRQALAHSLTSPCPEPGSDQDKTEDAGLADLSHLNADQLLYFLTEMDPSLGAAPCDSHPPQREKSGKLPEKTQLRKDNKGENQEDKLWEEIAGMTSLPRLAGPIPPEAPNSKLAALLQECAASGKVSANIPLSEYLYEQSLLEKKGENKLAQSQPRHPGNGHFANSYILP